MIKHKGDHIELKVIVEKYKKKIVDSKIGSKFLLDETGKRVKEAIEVYSGYLIVPTSFHRDGITLYGNSITSKFKLYKNRASVYDKYTNKSYLVYHTPEEIEESLKFRHSVGFKINQ